MSRRGHGTESQYGCVVNSPCGTSAPNTSQTHHNVIYNNNYNNNNNKHSVRFRSAI